MNKLDRYDAEKLLKAKQIINEVYEYNYMSESDALSCKLNTILRKIDKILKNELEQEIQEEYINKIGGEIW